MPLPACQLKFGSDSRIQFSVAFDPERTRGLSTSTGSLLLLPIEYEMLDPRTNPALLCIEGWLRWHEDTNNVGGLRIPSQVLNPNESYIRIPVTEFDLRAIETVRAGRPAIFQAYLNGLANVEVRQSDQSTTLRTLPLDTMSPGYLSFNRERWLDILTGLGYGKHWLVELPAVEAPRGAEAWAEAVRLLDRATRDFRSGEHEKAMEACREVVEGVMTVLADSWGIARQTGKNFGEWTAELRGRLTHAWPQDSDAAALLIALYQSSWTWLSPSHHYGSGMPLNQEAAFAIQLTSSLLTFGAQLLEAHPTPAGSSSPPAPSTAAPSS